MRSGPWRLRYNRLIEPGELHIRDSAQGARHVLELKGELDIASAPVLEAAMVRLWGEEATEVLLDLHGLDFIDSTGFRAILGAKQLCEDHGCTFLMTRGSEPVQKLFAVSGVLRKLPFA
jgi:anti-anti-sigma factor